MAEFSGELAETAMFWRKAVAPYAEEPARIFWQGRLKRSKFNCLPTRLTQARRSQAKAGNFAANVPAIPKTKPRCPICGGSITKGSTYCAKCALLAYRENLLQQAKLGRIATHSAIAEGRRSATQVKQAEALRKWNPSDLPNWLDEDFYRREILPRLSGFTVKKIRLAIGISHPYATLIKRGLKMPHPRHWKTLADLSACKLPDW